MIYFACSKCSCKFFVVSKKFNQCPRCGAICKKGVVVNRLPWEPVEANGLVDADAE